MRLLEKLAKKANPELRSGWRKEYNLYAKGFKCCLDIIMVSKRWCWFGVLGRCEFAL